MAANPTTSVLAAEADEVSAGITALFGVQSGRYQEMVARAMAFHQQFVAADISVCQLISHPSGSTML